MDRIQTDAVVVDGVEECGWHSLGSSNGSELFVVMWLVESGAVGCNHSLERISCELVAYSVMCGGPGMANLVVCLSNRDREPC